MTVARHLALVFRERRAQIEQIVLNRALLKRRGPIGRIATRLVLMQMPKIPPDEQTGGGPNQRGRLDAPPSSPQLAGDAHPSAIDTRH
jgi:hypothetical protein